MMPTGEHDVYKKLLEDGIFVISQNLATQLTITAERYTYKYGCWKSLTHLGELEKYMVDESLWNSRLGLL